LDDLSIGFRLEMSHLIAIEYVEFPFLATGCEQVGAGDEQHSGGTKVAVAQRAIRFVMGVYADNEHIPIFAAVPSLVQHIGEVSTESEVLRLVRKSSNPASDRNVLNLAILNSL
jgi:hypothetical protein